MAGLKLVANSGEVVLVASTVKTVLQIAMPAAGNQRALVTGIRITGKSAAGGVDVPIQVRLTRCINANKGTSGATATPGKLNPSNPEVVQSIANITFSVEPTSLTDTGIWWNVQPQSGIIEFFPPALNVEIPASLSGNTGLNCLNVECTPGTTGATITVSVSYEE